MLELIMVNPFGRISNLPLFRKKSHVDKQDDERIDEAIAQALEKQKLKAFEKREEKPVSYDDPKKYEITKEFIREKRLKLYGGTAINLLLPETDRFYSESDTPDYDIYSPNPWENAVELAERLYNNGFEYSEVRSGIHPGTFKVYANLWQVADITYVPKKVYRDIPTVDVDGLKIVSPEFLQVSMYKEFQEPFTNPERWKKVLPRQKLLLKNYPPKSKSPADCAVFLSETITPELAKDLSLIENYIRQRDLISYGPDAYNAYMKVAGSSIRIPESRYSVYSENAGEDAIYISTLVPNSYIETFYTPWKELYPMTYEVRVAAPRPPGRTIPSEGQVIAAVSDLVRCIPFKIIDGKKVVAIDGIKYSFYLTIGLGSEKEVERARCMLVDLENVQKKYYDDHGITELDEGPFQRLTSDCQGPYEHNVKETLYKRMKTKKKTRKIRPKTKNVRLRKVSGRTIRIYDDEENECRGNSKTQCTYPCYWDIVKKRCFDIPKGRVFRTDVQEDIDLEDDRKEGESEIYEF